MSLSAEALAPPAQDAPAASDTIDIALGVDAKYAPHAAQVIAGVVRHAPGGRFRFILLHGGVDRALQKRVEETAPEARFVWREISDEDLPAWADREHFSRAILFRLGIEKHAPADCRRLIYLDADIVVMDDVRQLWNTELKGNPVAAVVDCYVDPLAFAERWSLAPAEHGYFNSGILLIDLERVRAERLFTKAIEFVARHQDEIYLADQDALNFVMWRRWARLANRWNVQRHMVISSLIAETPAERRLSGRPAIVHFTGPEKPWLAEGYHPWSWLYWPNLKRTPFWGEISARHGMSALKRAMLWVRWMRKRV